MKLFLVACGVVVVSGLFIAGCAFTRFGYETPSYRVSRKSGAFEVREYGALTVVTAPMGATGQGRDAAFMRLFRYISKGNEDAAKISMTTPVLMAADAVPNGGAMSFIVPAKVAASHVPAPRDAELKVSQMKPARYAVIRLGGRDADEIVKAERRLRAWAAEAGLQVEGGAIVAGYDPPFTPGFMARNELLLRLAP